MKKRLIAGGWALMLLVVLCLLPSQLVAAKSTQQVNDTANVLSQRTLDAITKLNQDTFSKYPGHPSLAVETINTVPDDVDDIAELANQRFAELGVGQRGWDNGLLFEIAIADHKYWLEVGYGLEAVIPDGSASQIVTKAVKRDLKAERYDQAIAAVVANIAKKMKQNQAEIRTPASIKADKAKEAREERLVDGVLGGLMSLIGLGALTHFGRRQRLKARAKRPENWPSLPIASALSASAKADFASHLHLPLWQSLRGDAAFNAALARYLRDHLGQLIADTNERLPLPAYVYEQARLKKPLYGVLDEQLLNASSIAALADLVSPDLRDKQTVLAPILPSFVVWAGDNGISMHNQQRVYRELVVNVDDILTTPVDQLPSTFHAILKHLDDPDSDIGTSVPGWVVTSYGPSASSGSSFGSGSGFGGGSSGGGGFGGSW